MPHTDKSTVVALAIKDLILSNKETLGLDYVDYGDHNNIPGGKSVAVRAGTKRRELAGVAGPGGRTLNRIEVLVSVYFSVLDNEANARRNIDELAEKIEDLLHEDTTVGGLIIHGFVNDWIPDTVYRETSMYRLVQLTFVGQTKTNITQ